MQSTPRYPAYSVDSAGRSARGWRLLATTLTDPLDLGLWLSNYHEYMGGGAFSWALPSLPWLNIVSGYRVGGNEPDRVTQLMTPELVGVLRHIAGHGFEATLGDDTVSLRWRYDASSGEAHCVQFMHAVVAAIDRARPGVRCATRWLPVRARLQALSGTHGFEMRDTPIRAYRAKSSTAGHSSLAGWGIGVWGARETIQGSWTATTHHRLTIRIDIPKPLSYQVRLAPLSTVIWWSRFFPKRRTKTGDSDFDRRFYLLTNAPDAGELIPAQARQQLLALVTKHQAELWADSGMLTSRFEYDARQDVGALLDMCLTAARAIVGAR